VSCLFSISRLLTLHGSVVVGLACRLLLPFPSSCCFPSGKWHFVTVNVTLKGVICRKVSELKETENRGILLPIGAQGVVRCCQMFCVFLGWQLLFPLLVIRWPGYSSLLLSKKTSIVGKAMIDWNMEWNTMLYRIFSSIVVSVFIEFVFAVFRLLSTNWRYCIEDIQDIQCQFSQNSRRKSKSSLLPTSLW